MQRMWTAKLQTVTGTRLHADEAGWDRCNQFKQCGPGHAVANLHDFACGIHAMHGEDVLGEIDADGVNGVRGLPLLQ